MNFLTAEQLEKLNATNDTNDTMYIVEELDFIKNGYNLRHDGGDTIVCMTNSFTEALSYYKEHCQKAHLNAKYYEVFISRAFSTDSETVEYYQLKDYTYRNCLPSNDKTEAEPLKTREYYVINLYKDGYNLLDNTDCDREQYETLEEAHDGAMFIFKHFYNDIDNWLGVRLVIELVHEQTDTNDDIVSQEHEIVEEHKKGFYFNTLENPKNKGVFVCIRENGDIIDEAKTIEDGLKLIDKFEEKDKEDGTYTESFYCLCDCDITNIEL